jgi:hypothetical protein
MAIVIVGVPRYVPRGRVEDLAEIGICFSVGKILLHFITAGQANPTLKKPTLARYISVRGMADGIYGPFWGFILRVYNLDKR